MTYHSRFEYKYLVTPSQARMITRELRPFMRLDPWLERKKLDHYTVSSLYLDSPQMQCYEAVEQGEKNRFKLRIRWYGDEISEPVFLEEKRRTNDCISKSRVGLKADSVNGLLQGRGLTSQDLLCRKSGDLATGMHLLNKMHSIDARNSCIVRYKRNAWIGKRDSSVRVTFDTTLSASTCGSESGEKNSVDSEGTILEIKFITRIPEWLASIIHRHGLRRQSVPKYVMCIDQLSPREKRLQGCLKILPMQVHAS